MLMNRTTPFMVPVDDANPAIIKNEALCSECGHCFAVCEEEIGVAAKYLLNQREAYQCIGCGQCVTQCPVDYRRLVRDERNVFVKTQKKK